MAEPETSTSSNKLYTLSEISQKTGISMPTLQRYKKLYQGRIPSEGKGRKQRYPEESLPVFEELKVENAGRRGRPRKDDSTRSSANASGTGSTRSGRGRKAAAAKTPAAAGRAGRGSRGGRKATAPAAAAAKKTGRGGRKAAGAAPSASGRGGRSSGLLTLTQISEQTGISYPTLVRYVRVHSSRLPSEGSGRARRFHPEAVDVFRQLRGESGRGGRKPAAATAAKSTGRGRGRAASSSARGGRTAAAAGGNDPGTTQRLRALERAQQDLEKRFRGFVSSLQKLFR